MTNQFKTLKQDLIILGFAPKRSDYDSIEESIYGDPFYYLKNGVPDVNKIDCFEKKIKVKSDYLSKVMATEFEYYETINLHLHIAFPNSDYFEGDDYPNTPELKIFIFGEFGEYTTYPIKSVLAIEQSIKEFSKLKKFSFNKAKQKQTLYVISHENRVKIGITDNIFRRFKTFQMQSPYNLKLLLFSFLVDEMSDTEKALHFVFRNQRVHGEWFNLTDFQIKNIRSICNEVWIKNKSILKSNKTIEDLTILNGSNVTSFFYPKLSVKEQLIILKEYNK